MARTLGDARVAFFRTSHKVGMSKITPKISASDPMTSKASQFIALYVA